MNNSAACSLCGVAEETILHVLRDCCFARKVWEFLVPDNYCDIFSNCSIEDWLVQNLQRDYALFDLNNDWRCLFITTVWRLWTRRCSLSFDESNHTNISFSQFVYNVQMGAAELRETFAKPKPQKQDPKLLSWSPPPLGWVKLNTDGAARDNPGKAGAGGLIRSHTGRWITGFQAYLGCCSNTVAELQALKLGLLLVWSEGYRSVLYELDAQVVIQLVKTAYTQMHPHGCIIADIREILSRSWNVDLRHAYRESNFCADKLAKLACDLLQITNYSHKV